MTEHADDDVLNDTQIRGRLYRQVADKAQVTQSRERDDFVRAWYSRMIRREQLSDRFKYAYFILLTLNALAAASVPALIAAAGSSQSQAANAMRLIAAALGVLIAVTTSVLGVIQIGTRWRLYRTYSQELEEAGWDYVNSDKATGYGDFVKAVTTARRLYDREYLKDVANPAPQTPSGPPS